MTRTYAYFYSVKEDAEVLKEVIFSHVAYWQGCALETYSGGPFTEHTGGVISFGAESLEEASTIIEKDPFTAHDIIGTKWVKEWEPDIEL